jgi:thioredoxin reductase
VSLAEYDLIIVGSGFFGLTVAERAAAASIRLVKIFDHFVNSQVSFGKFFVMRARSGEIVREYS